MLIEFRNSFNLLFFNMKDFSKFSFLLLLFSVILIGCGESTSDDSSAGEGTESNEGSSSSDSFGEMKGTEVANLMRPFYNAAKNMNGEFDKAKWTELEEGQKQGEITVIAEVAQYLEAGIMGDKPMVYLTVPEKYGMSSVQCTFKGTDNMDKIVIDEDNGVYPTLSVKGTFEDAMTVNLKSESSMSVTITMVDCELIGVK